MAEQLRHVNEVGQLANVTVHVLPLSVGQYRGAGVGAFTILEFPSNGNGRETEPPTVYAGSLTGALYLDRPNEVAAYDNLWTDLTSIALDESQSRELIGEIAEEYGGS